MGRRVTLRDIADEAGVSVMTVSNSLNGKTARVSEATQERIEGIARSRGYVASASARSLAVRASKLIGLLVLTDAAQHLSLSPYNVEIFSAIEHELRARGYHVLFRGVSSVPEVDLALRTWDLDGAIVLGFPDRMVDVIGAPDGTPIVALDSYATGSSALAVRSNDREGGRLAAEHLLDHGHTRILFAGPRSDGSGVIRERLDGFIEAFAQHGLEWRERDRALVESTHEAGVELGRSIRRSHPEVTAVFATADALALGVMNGARGDGMAIPRDLSVVGFDNLEADGWTTPTLTSIDQDVSAKAAHAARALLHAITESGATEPDVKHRVRLIPRESVADASRG